MKRSSKGIWTLTDDEMHMIRAVFAFADLENALTAEEKQLEKRMDDVHFTQYRNEMAQIEIDEYTKTIEEMEESFNRGEI